MNMWWRLLMLGTLATLAWGKERHGGDFLRAEVGAAPVARGLSGLLLADGGTRAWWNPALLVDGGAGLASFQHQEAFGGILSLDYLSWSARWNDLPVAVFLLRQAVPDIPISRLLEGGGTFEEGGRPVVRREDAADWILGLSTARELRPGLAGGLTLKLIHRDLAVLRGQGLGLDAGLRWQTEAGLALGLSLRDLTGSVLFWEDGEQDWIAPEWAVGAALDRSLPRWRSRLRGELALRGELEGAVPDRDGRWRRAWLHGGAEWIVLERLALRAGLAEGDPAAGAGLILGRWSVDYAWRPHQELGASHLVTLSALLP
ncbi:MAG: hypothetical protein Q8O14_15475 [bacterium]|jgi:hypothetical protein|nr:hypothetical protein [bacterium]